MLLALFGLASAQAATAYGTFSPSCTNNGVTTAVERQCTSGGHDADHHVWVPNPGTAAEDRLLVFLPGTKNEARDHDWVAQIAANAGFRVIVLSYDSNQEDGAGNGQIGAFCNTHHFGDTACHGDLGERVLFGSGSGVALSNHNMDDQDTVHARLVDVLTQLDAANPTHGWDDYLNDIDVADPYNDADWCNFLFAGFSQGAAYAAQLGSMRDVGGVVMLDGPGAVGDWLTATHETDPDLWFAVHHVNNNDKTAQWDDLGVPNGQTALNLGGGGPWPMTAGDHRVYVTSGQPAGCTAHKSLALDNCMVRSGAVPKLNESYQEIFLQAAAAEDPECAP